MNNYRESTVNNVVATLYGRVQTAESQKPKAKKQSAVDSFLVSLECIMFNNNRDDAFAPLGPGGVANNLQTPKLELKIRDVEL
jgi:hypothetical protein